MCLLYRPVEINREYSMAWRWISILFHEWDRSICFIFSPVRNKVKALNFLFITCSLVFDYVRYCMQYTMRHHNCLLFLHSGNKTFIFPQCEKHCLWQNPVFKGWKCNKLEYSFASLCTCNSLVTNMIYWNTNRINLFAKQYWHMYNITLTWSCFQFIDLARR